MPATKVHLILIFLSQSLVSHCVEEYRQRALLYDLSDCKGHSLELNGEYAPSLHNLHFNNKAESVRVTGTWLFYYFSAYNERVGNAGVEYLLGRGEDCVNFQFLKQKASSARFAGANQDYREDSLTLFNGTYFQGAEEYLTEVHPYLAMETVGSLIITGNSSWTIYSEDNFLGYSFCIKLAQSEVQQSSSFFIENVAKTLKFETVGSAQKGCAVPAEVFSIVLSHGFHNVTR